MTDAERLREVVVQIVRDIISDYTEFGHVDDAEVQPYARRILDLVRPTSGEPVAWRPWSDCPHDGRIVLAWFANDYIETVYAHPDGWTWHDGDTSRGITDPKFWMPLPVGPSITQRDTEGARLPMSRADDVVGFREAGTEQCADDQTERAE